MTHVIYRVVFICIKNNILLICLPAPSSHILQPLDIGVYCYVKRVWRKLLQQFYAETKFSNLSKERFSKLQAKLFSSSEVFTRTQIVTGFQNTSLFPLDISQIDQSKLQIANTFETPSSQPEPSSSQPPESMKEPPSLLAPGTTPSQPLLPESISTTSSISMCRIASASKSAPKSTRLQTTFNSVVTPAIQKEIQREVEKQLQSAQSLAAALQQMFCIQQVDTKKRKNVDLPRFEGECLNKPKILERLKGAESKKAAKQAKKQRKLGFNDEQQITQATIATPTTITAANQLKCKKCRNVLCEASSSQYMEWNQCENSKCEVWLCQTCISKRYVKGAEFYCTKKCRKSDNSTQPLVLLNNSTSSQE